MVSLVFAGQSGPRFTPIVKRLNMLRPARYPRSGEAGPGLTSYVADWSKAAHYFKDWLPFNLADEGGSDTDTSSFGAFITAPDATTDTARKLVSTSANSQHSFIAGWNNVNQSYYGKLRDAAIFKAGEYERVVLEMSSQPTNAGGVGKIGCKAGFDLLNGRVFMDTTAIGSPDTPWTLFSAKIFHIGDQFYFCYFDAICNTNLGGMATGLFSKVYLDNGTGLAAESTTFAGDGTSGIYGWRANMLPTRAWNLGTVAFFEGFDDPLMANFDLANSLAPGFRWYIRNGNPAYGFANPVTDITKLSVADSVFTCTGHPHPLFLSTFASTSLESPLSTGYVGDGFTIPSLVEFRAKWDISLSDQSGYTTGWTNSREFLATGKNQSITAGCEYDYFETQAGGRPLSTMHWIPEGPIFSSETLTSVRSSIGLDVWYAGRGYQIGAAVSRLGTAYTSLTDNINSAPETNPLDWGPFVQKNSQPTSYQAGVDWPVADYAAGFNDFQTMRFRYDPTTGEPGQIVIFYNDVMSSFALAYAPGLKGDTSDDVYLADDHHYPILFGTNPTVPINFDHVRITQ